MFAPFRSSGLKLSPAQLPGRFGQGEVGPQAVRWLEALVEMGQRAWFIPETSAGAGLGDGSAGARSVFAGDPLEVCFEGLLRDGLLQPRDLRMIPDFPEGQPKPQAVREVRSAVLQLAAERFLRQCEQSPLVRGAFEAFCDREASWLDDFALFAALEEAQSGRRWTEWPAGLAEREPGEMAAAMVELEPEMEVARALQFFHDRQWRKLRQQARSLGVWLMSSLPAGLAAESPEAWIYQENGAEGLFGPRMDWKRACVQRRGACFDVLRVEAASTGTEAGMEVMAEHGPIPLLEAGEPYLRELTWQGEDLESWWEAVERVWRSDAAMVLADAEGFWEMPVEGLGRRLPDLDNGNERFYKILTELRGLTFKTGRCSREFLQL